MPKEFWWLLVNIIIYLAFFVIFILVQLRQWFAVPSEKEAEEEVQHEEEHDKKEGHANQVKWKILLNHLNEFPNKELTFKFS